MVGRDGTMKQLRSLTERAGCTRNQETNLSAIQVVVAGDFTKEEPNPKQLAAVRKLIKDLDAVYHFEKITGHREQSSTQCPGEKLHNAIQDLLKGDDDYHNAAEDAADIWNISRYYTPVRGQERYYRTISDKDFIHKALEFGLVEWVDEKADDPLDVDMPGYWYSFASASQFIGQTLEEADAWFNARPEHKQGIRKEMEYLADFRVNCSGDCLVPADGSTYTDADAGKVAACPPEYPFGTKFEIEGMGTVTCRDHGSAIKQKKIDVWTGIGMSGLTPILTTGGGPRKGRQL